MAPYIHPQMYTLLRMGSQGRGSLRSTM